MLFRSDTANDLVDLKSEALRLLRETSRTFYLPICGLPDGLLEAVASAYLCMRAIDEVEDHPGLDPSLKAPLLRQISLDLQSAVHDEAIQFSFMELSEQTALLPEVTGRIMEWSALAPMTIAPRIWEATSTMADRMAYWAEIGWRIETEGHLNQYTFSVAGSVGLLLSEIGRAHV